MRLHALVLASALALPALAQAQKAKTPAQQPAPKSQAQGQAQQQPGAGGAPQEEKLNPAEKAAREQAILDTFKGKENFQMEGKVVYVGENNMVLDRQGLPVAFLIVPSTAPVQLDGKPSQYSQLKPGTEVRATFNLAQQYPIALKLDAKSTPQSAPAQGGATGTAPGTGVDNTTPDTTKSPADMSAPKDKTLGTDRGQPVAPPAQKPRPEK